MQTKTKILIAAVAASALVVASQRKKIMTLLANQPVSGMGDGAIPGTTPPPAPTLQATAMTTQQVAQIVNTLVTTLAGIAGLTLTAMTLTEKKRALAKT